MFLKVKDFLWLCVISTAFLSGCTYRQTVHGSVVYDAYEHIEPGLDTKKQVLQAMGEPSLTGAFRPNTWYYVSSRRDHNSLQLPKRVEHSVVILTFNKDNLLVDKTSHSALDFAPVSPDREQTNTVTVERGILQEIFGNVGQLN